MDDFLLDGFVERHLRLFEVFFGFVSFTFGNGLLSRFYGRSKLTLYFSVFFGLARSDAHVFFGSFFDRHESWNIKHETCNMRNKPFMLYVLCYIFYV